MRSRREDGPLQSWTKVRVHAPTRLIASIAWVAPRRMRVSRHRWPDRFAAGPDVLCFAAVEHLKSV
jgi:hypothetical protein